MNYLDTIPTKRPCLIAQSVKNLPTMQETWVQFLSWKDPLKLGEGNGNPLQSSCLAGYSQWGLKS